MLRLTGVLLLAFAIRCVDALPTGSQRVFATQNPSSGLFSDEALQWVEGIRLKYDMPGIAIGATASPDQAEDVWIREVLSFGHKNHLGQPVDAETMIHIASNSKLFVAMSINLLIDNQTVLANGELLDYDTKVKDALPGWWLLDPYMSKHLDLLDLLSKRTGMPSHYGTHVKKNSTQMVEQLGHLRASTEIRQTMQYNDYHFWVLAEIVVQLSGRSVPDYVQEHLLDPLGMTSTTFNHTEAAETGRLAGGYERSGIDPVECRKTWREYDALDRACYGYPVATEWFIEGDGIWYTGPAGVVVSYSDMLNWLKELLEPKVIPEYRVAKSHECLIPAFGHPVPCDEVSNWCYGQATMSFNYRGHEVIFHHGTHPGAGSLVVRVPVFGIGLFVTNNELIIGEMLNIVILYRLLDDF